MEMRDMEQEKIVVLDFGGQYNQLIARRVRECNVYAEIFPYTTELSVIREMNPKGIIFTGGPNSVYDSASPHFAREICDLKIPILGICYGAQLLSWMEGGTVETAPVSEYGHARLQVDESADPLFKGVTPGTVVWMSHTDYISKVPEGFRITAHTKDCPVAAMSCPERRLYAVQFHPEVMHTREGQTMLRNFVLGVCGCSGEWKMGSFVEQSIHRLDAATAALRLARRGNRTARSNIISCEVGTIIWIKAIDNRFFERYHSETERQRRLEEFLRDAFSFIYSE